VFVGANIPTKQIGERKDEFPTPYTSAGHFLAGVDVQATQFLNLLRGDWLRRPSRAKEQALILLVGLVFGAGLAWFRPLHAAEIALGSVLAITAVAHWLMWQKLGWFPWLILAAGQVFVALAWAILYNSVAAYIKNRLLEQSLGLYLSPKQVQRLLKEPGMLKPGGAKQTVSILFSDIAGFSRISEQLDPAELVALLNSYYEQTIRCIHQTEGTVVDIIGDAIFAIWNAPEAQPDHRERLLRTAQLFQENVSNFNARAGSLPLKTRVGLHTGEVVVGNVGSSEHFDFTAIGENVNLSSRLEGLNKHLGTVVLLTREVLPTDAGGPAALAGRLRSVGRFRFKGFEKAYEVLELVPAQVGGAVALPWCESFAAALKQFQSGEFAEAGRGFQRVLELRPDDGPSRFYLKEIELFGAAPPPPGWIGDVEMKEK